VQRSDRRAAAASYARVSIEGSNFLAVFWSGFAVGDAGLDVALCPYIEGQGWRSAFRRTWIAGWEFGAGAHPWQQGRRS
jgi:hypothetical protein